MNAKQLVVWNVVEGMMCACLLLYAISSPALGIAYDDAADGDWSASATWGVGSGYPGTGSDTALINQTRTIELDVSVTLDGFTVTGNALQELTASSANTISTGNFVSGNINNFIIGSGVTLDLTGTGLYQTRGGTVNGTIDVQNGAVLTYTNNQAQNGSGNINILPGGKIDMQSNSFYNQFDGATGLTLDNDGLFEINNSTSFRIQALNVSGDGQWQLNSGGVSFNNANQNITLNPNTAIFSGAVGTVLFDNVADGSHTLGSFNMSGTSTVQFSDGTLSTFQINGPSTFGNLSVTSGDVVDFAPLGGGSQLHSVSGTLTFSSGTLTASDAAGAVLNVTDFSGITSSTTIDTGVTLNLAGTGSMTGNGSMTMNGNFNLLDGANLTVITREVFGAGTFSLAANSEMILDGTANSNRKIDPNIINNGLIQSVNNNIRPLNGAISGTGTFLAESGTLDLDAGSTDVEGWGDGSTGIFDSLATWHAQGAGVIDLRGGTDSMNTIGSTATVILEDGGTLAQLNTAARNNLTVDGELHVRGTSDLLFNGGQGINLSGVLGGDGTITGNVMSAGGTLQPGNSPGTLTINGDLTLDSSSLLEFELGGGDDLIVVTGALTLDGVLNVTDLGGFGQGTYDLIQYGSLTDNELSLGLLPDAGYAYSILTGGGVVQLQVTSVAIPEPASGMLLAVGGICLLSSRRKRRNHRQSVAKLFDLEIENRVTCGC